MGLFSKLFGHNKKQERLAKAISYNQDYEDLLKESQERLESARKEGELIDKELNDIIVLRQQAQKFEKENKLHEAIDTYLQSIKNGEESTRLKINSYAFDIERVFVLYSKTKQKELLKTFLKEKISLYSDYRSVNKWSERLSKLVGDVSEQVETIMPQDIVTQKPSIPSLGKMLNDFKKNMPEFNFYYDMPSDSSTVEYNPNIPSELFGRFREFKEAFITILSIARIAENEGDYKKAIEAYEYLIVEEYEGAEPYERLIVIYSKLKWLKDEQRIVESAIPFFTNLRETQFEYVLSLAKKYKMEAKAMEYINADKKISYYGGVFELYNPQKTRLIKWANRLGKINQKLEKK